VSQDRREALVSLVTGSAQALPPFWVLKLKGLDPDLRYQVSGDPETYPGDVLMEAGYPVPVLLGDYQSLQLYLHAEA
jgi:alpha-galactosidase